MNGIEVLSTVDTGSAVSLLTEQTGRRLGLNYRTPVRPLVAANGSHIDVLGASDVKIYNSNITANATVYVSRTASSNLLGRPQIEALQLLEFVNNVTDGVFDPVTASPKLFEGLGTTPIVGLH